MLCEHGKTSGPNPVRRDVQALERPEKAIEWTTGTNNQEATAQAILHKQL
jgi:hypothetical protein